MRRNIKAFSIAFTLVFTLFTLLCGMPAKAAIMKTVIPEVQFSSAPVTEYTTGERVQFNIYSPNFGGKVEYRVVLWDDSKKTYSDLWNGNNGYPGRYYTKWQPTGNTIFTLGWPIFEPGTYRITVYAKRVGVAASKAALAGMNCDSFKQSLAFTVKPRVTLLDKEGQAYGSSDINKLEIYKGDTKITENNITLNNAKIEGDLYISGNNAVIKNVSTAGKIIVDPGKDGSTTLENVTAKNIEVLSGGKNSIHIKNVQAESMNVSSSTPVRIEADGETEIVSTTATGYVIFDRKNGTYGTITISNGSNGVPVIEFRGEIKDKVQVETAATIKTNEDSKISNLVIATEKVTDTVKLEGQYDKVEVAKEAKVEIGETAVITDTLKVSAKADIKADAKSDVKKVDIATPTNEIINLEGKFTKVEINSEAKVEVAANTKIGNIVANKNAQINLDKTAVVDKVDKGSNTVVVGGEGQVGPSAPPTTGGSTGGGGGWNPPVDTTVSVSGISVNPTKMDLTVGGATGTITATVSPSNATNKNVTWSSSNTGVATINNGVVTAVSEGIATITVTTVDGSKIGTCAVTVKAAPVVTVAEAKDVNQLKAALVNIDIKTINITADISAIAEALVVNKTVTINGGGHKLTFTAALNTLANGSRQGTLVMANNTIINNLTVEMSGAAGWQGVYGIQVYNTTGVKLNNITASGADGGVLVNAQGKVEGANVPTATNTTLKADQTQYYMVSGNVTGIERSVLVNGGEKATCVINDRKVTFGGEIAFYQAGGEAQFPIAGNWVGFRITAPAGIMPDENAELKFNGAIIHTGWEDLKEPGSESNSFHLNKRVKDISDVYEITMKWNNKLTETYTIDFAAGTILSAAPSALDVSKLYQLKEALENEAITTINITEDITDIPETLVIRRPVTINGGNKRITFTNALNGLANGQRQGILILADGTMINDLSIQMSGEDNWQGVYGIQVYNSAGVILNNVTASGADGGILVNGSTVELKGSTTVSENEFGGIEVSKGTAEGLSNSVLTVTGNLVNADEAYGRPTIWLVNGQGKVEGANVPAATNTTLKTDQTQYYMIPGNITGIERSVLANGGEKATCIINGNKVTFGGEIAFYQVGEDDTTFAGNWVGVKITAPAGIMPDENAVLKNDNVVLGSTWSDIRDKGDGDNFFHLYIRVRDIARTYNVEIKWNNVLTETYVINFEESTILAVYRKGLKDTIEGAKYNYDNADTYGSISDQAKQALQNTINNAQAVYDNTNVEVKTEAIQLEIFNAQKQLEEALDTFFDSFETTLEAASDNMAINTTYTDANPLVITISLENGIGDFATGLMDKITLEGTLSTMTIKSVINEGSPARSAAIEITGTTSDNINGGIITIAKGGVNGHSHEFAANFSKTAVVEPTITLTGIPTNVLAEEKALEDNSTGQITGFTTGSRTPIEVTLTKGSADYSNVRVIVEGLSDGIQLIAQDSVGNWYNIVKSGWGPAGGFELADATTCVYLVAYTVGTYNAEIRLVDISNSNKVLATATAEVIVTDEADPEFTISDGFLMKYNGPGGNVVIPEGVIRVLDDAFAQNTSITSIYFPKSVEYVGNGKDALEGCTSITSLTFSNTTQFLNIDLNSHVGIKELNIYQGVTDSKAYNCFSPAVTGNSTIEKINIGEGITEIDVFAFKGYKALNQVNLPNSLKVIAQEAFAGCESLTLVTLPNGLETIGGSSFIGCIGLSEIVIPNGIKDVDNSAFQNCNNLTKVSIPNGLTINSDIFNGCSNLNTLHITLSPYTTVLNTIYADVKHILIDEGITNINAGTFINNTKVIELQLPGSIQSIEGSAFIGCTSLESITIPCNANTQSNTFIDCPNIRKVTVSYNGISTVTNNLRLPNTVQTLEIAEGITRIESGSFNSLPLLTTLMLPNSLIEIGSDCFNDSLNLTI